MGSRLRTVIGMLALLPLFSPAIGCVTAGGSLPAGSVPIYEDHVFTGEAVIAGRCLMAGVCRVPAGSTLRVLPGAQILFRVVDRDGDGRGDAALKIEGRLLAMGSAEEPVLFSSAGDAHGRRRPGDWDAIQFDFSEGSEISGAIVEYSSYALHAHFSSGVLKRSLVRRNLEGCRMGQCRWLFEGNLIRDNVSKGLNFRDCANAVRGNRITANGNGIFIFEKDSGTVIEGNELFGNERYDLRLDDFFRGELVTGVNWWGSARESAVLEKIYDRRHDPDIGLARAVLADGPVIGAGEGFPFDDRWP